MRFVGRVVAAAWIVAAPAIPGVARAEGVAVGKPSMIGIAPSPGSRPVRAGAPVGPTVLEAPANLSDLSAWLDYRNRGHFAALPVESRVFYRRGLSLYESGARAEALRLVRGAAELDPGYVSPHLTLAAWFLGAEPGQALQQVAAALELVRDSFSLQLGLTANLLYLLLQSLFLGMLATGVSMLVVHQSKLRHAWAERLSRFISPRTAGIWSWAFLLLPFFAGLGIALPTVALLGFLWPHFKVRERALWIGLVVSLVAIPLVVTGLDRLSSPMREDRGPFYGVPLLQSRPDMEGQHGRIAALLAREPDNRYLHFARGWLARSEGDLATAETAYRRVLAIAPGDDRALNNLGNLMAAQGRIDEALKCYQQASALRPGNAASHFNASQIYTLRFDYHDATDELSRASAINFDLVKTYQSQGGDDGWLPLVSQWIAPATCWRDLSWGPSGSAEPPTLPPAWRSRIECSGPAFSILALVLAILAAVAGEWLQRSLPLRACNNCGRTVCRRCAARRREHALCTGCAEIESRAESPDFARVLLLQHRRRVLQRRAMLRTALAALVPGFGLVAFRQVIAPMLLLTTFACLATMALGLGAPFATEPRMLMPAADVPWAVAVSVWVGLYTMSLCGYLAREAAERAHAAALAAPVRTRVTQATTRTDQQAA